MRTERRSEWVMQALAEHEASLLRYAATIVGPARAPDVVQDTFLKLCAEETDAVAKHLAAWLFSVCRNRALDLVRAERRLTTLQDETMEQGDDGGPASALERKEAVTRVGAALGALTPRERELLWLKVDGGLRYKEIAEVMKLSVSNVGFILHGAIAKLRKELGHVEVPQETLLERTP